MGQSDPTTYVPPAAPAASPSPLTAVQVRPDGFSAATLGKHLYDDDDGDDDDNDDRRRCLDFLGDACALKNHILIPPPPSFYPFPPFSRSSKSAMYSVYLVVGCAPGAAGAVFGDGRRLVAPFHLPAAVPEPGVYIHNIALRGGKLDGGGDGDGRWRGDRGISGAARGEGTGTRG